MKNIKNVEFNIALDVHKKTTTCVVRDKYGQIAKQIKCASLYKEVHQVVEPYLFSCVIGLEACTSYYHIYEGFKKDGYDIRVANTLQIRQLLTKNDRLDAARLAEMLRLGSFPESYIPDEHVQKLRSLVHFRHKMRNEKTRVKNQIHAFLDKAGVKIPHKPFGKKWLKIFEHYLNETGSVELSYAYEHYTSTNERLNRLTNDVVGYSQQYWQKEFNLLTSIVGFGPVRCSYMIAEVHPIQRFANEKKLRRYGGVVPATKESDDVKIKGHIPKTSTRPLLRYALTGAANSIVRTDTRLARYYRKKKKQLGNTGMAKMAVACSLSDIAYKVLTTGKPYEV